MACVSYLTGRSRLGGLRHGTLASHPLGSCCGWLAGQMLVWTKSKWDLGRKGRQRTPDAAAALLRGTEEWNSPVTDSGLADMMMVVVFQVVLYL